MTVSIIGTAHTKFGRLDENVYELLVKAGSEALEESKVDAKKIDGIWVGNYSGGGFNNQEHLAPIALDIHPDLRFTPATRVENACASGSAAISAAKNAIEAGTCEYALVIGVEKMNQLDTKGVTKVLAMASHWEKEAKHGLTFPGLFAEFAKGYMKEFDISEEEMRDTLAMISSKNYRNALKNPYAHLPLDLSKEDVLNLPDKKNPMIAYPLRLNDCSLVSDGAAAIVITTTENAKKMEKEAVEIASLVHVTDYLELDKRPQYVFEGSKIAVDQAYEQANITVDDLDFAEVHDCFTIAELLAYNAIGLVENGKEREVLLDGTVTKEGKLPVNISGGLKAKGHPVGTTGVSMAVLATRQLLGNAIGIQLDNPKTGLTLNFGGSAVSSYATVFRKL